MKTVGIIGGIGPESTIEYYRLIIKLYKQRKSSGNSFPSIIINSIDNEKMLGLIGANRLVEAATYLVDELQKLERAGANFALLAANTPHIVFEEIERRVSIPLISIVEATVGEAKKLGLKKVGLFGTRFTMQAEFYQTVFSKQKITIVLPEREERDFIHDIYLNELLNGIFLPETRERLLEIAGKLKERKHIDGLILGGTELPLILSEADGHGIPFLDTTKIHVNAIVERLLSE
jgi:aspartate racemase